MRKKQITKIFAGCFMIAFLAAYPVQSKADQNAYTVDPVHSSLIFAVKHLDTAYFYGRINGVSGTIRFDPDAPEKTQVEITVLSENVDTDNEKRDKHVRSTDFFDAKNHSKIHFVSTSVKEKSENLYAVQGKLSFRGVTRPINIDVGHTGAGKDPWGGFRRGFKTQFTIQRSDFGMDYMLGPISDAVDIILSVEVIAEKK